MAWHPTRSLKVMHTHHNPCTRERCAAVVAGAHDGRAPQTQLPASKLARITAARRVRCSPCATLAALSPAPTGLGNPCHGTPALWSIPQLPLSATAPSTSPTPQATIRSTPTSPIKTPAPPPPPNHTHAPSAAGTTRPLGCSARTRSCTRPAPPRCQRCHSPRAPPSSRHRSQTGPRRRHPSPAAVSETVGRQLLECAGFPCWAIVAGRTPCHNPEKGAAGFVCGPIYLPAATKLWLRFPSLFATPACRQSCRCGHLMMKAAAKGMLLLLRLQQLRAQGMHSMHSTGGCCLMGLQLPHMHHVAALSAALRSSAHLQLSPAL